MRVCISNLIIHPDFLINSYLMWAVMGYMEVHDIV